VNHVFPSKDKEPRKGRVEGVRKNLIKNAAVGRKVIFALYMN
jgi:hypothetical protein